MPRLGGTSSSLLRSQLHVTQNSVAAGGINVRFAAYFRAVVLGVGQRKADVAVHGLDGRRARSWPWRPRRWATFLSLIRVLCDGRQFGETKQ